MNIFIMRHYFILTDLETNAKTYLTPLHARFNAQFPNMEVGKQRVGDQRRAIVQRNFLSKEEIRNIKEEVRNLLSKNQHLSLNTNTDIQHTQSNRIRWTNDLNETIMRSYYRLTKLETDLTTYRPLLHQDIVSKCPSISHLSAQRIADQRRSIVNNRLLSTDQLNRIRQEVQNEIISNTAYTLGDSTQLAKDTSVISTDPIETIQINSSQRQTTNSNDQPSLSTELQQQLEEMFWETFHTFKDTHPTTRPYLPKLKPSKRLASIINYLNTDILTKIVTIDTDFKTTHAIIYCAAYTATKFNGAKILDTCNLNSNSERKPRWQRRLEGRISELRANIGRLTEYIRGVRSTALQKHINKIKEQYKIHSQHETQNNDLSHYLDTLKQKLNALASRLRRYKETTLRKVQNKQFGNNEKLFYRNLTSPNSSPENNSPLPTPETLHTFWSNIWSNPVEHIENSWIAEDRQTLKNIPEMEFDNIPIDLLKAVISKTHNWKAPGSRISSY
ncbi:hypothetical protein O3G_MSEX000243 [Manduca sexta]|nr:hypothetical protein O3G_MSEX000243 [Manduca sexta]